MYTRTITWNRSFNLVKWRLVDRQCCTPNWYNSMNTLGALVINLGSFKCCTLPATGHHKMNHGSAQRYHYLCIIYFMYHTVFYVPPWLFKSYKGFWYLLGEPSEQSNEIYFSSFSTCTRHLHTKDIGILR